VVVGMGLCIVLLCIGVLDYGGDRRRGRGSFGGAFGTLHDCQWKFNGYLCRSGCGIVAKRLTGSGCRWDGGWVGPVIGVLNFGGDRRRGRSSFGRGESLELSIVINGIICVTGDVALPKLLWFFLVK